MMNIVEHNSQAWDKQADNGNVWTMPVSSEIISAARKGSWDIVLTPTKPVPKSWFPQNLSGLKVLCLASGGGQQGPVLAAAGADVIVLDISEKQLQKDNLVAVRDGLDLKIVKGTMTDLHIFEDDTFDLIVHPVSNMYVEEIRPIWLECYRVLKKNGRLISGFANPLVYLFDPEAEEEGKLEVRYSIPFSDLKSLPEHLLKQYLAEGDPVIFGHSLEDQLAGQTDAGFAIRGMYEDNYGGRRLLDEYINTFIATLAIK
jgi:ubiquinone/menaquinone biosynthesis C-methylase UbiE